MSTTTTTTYSEVNAVVFFLLLLLVQIIVFRHHNKHAGIYTKLNPQALRAKHSTQLRVKGPCL